ncbi:hypothetical protein FQR65_LT05242 [Abscondita terminalis]|nr:hypothetical protein FQR65_LT05242 [Abscondita terminalis]
MKSALSPTENLYLCLTRRNLIHKQPKRKAIQAIHQILDQLDLKACSDTLLAQLSAGQQRRLSLAKLLLIKADCWILDEPFTSLDSAGIAFLSSLMEKQSARGGVIVFSSHQATHSLSLEIKNFFLDANELLAIFRYYQELTYPLLFLILAIILFPLSISADPILLKKISAGIYWVVVLFLVLLMLDQLFRNDWNEGDLEQLILLPNELSLVLFVSYYLFIPLIAFKTLYLTILLGIPTLIFLGGIGRALTLGLRQSGLLIILIITPFYIPILIFASSAVALASLGLPANGPLAWLGVLMILSMSLAPLAISKILRLGLILRIKLAELIVSGSVFLGAWFTFLALLTGSVWAKPSVVGWDARLTSELILLFLYLGVIALRSAIPERQMAAQATAILLMLGLANIPIIHYSVYWWNTLHQGATLHFFSPSLIEPRMLYPLLSMMAAFISFYFIVLLLHIRCEILEYSIKIE